MPIKFGDLIENSNSSYAVIDLTDNQSRGVAFLDDILPLSGTTSAAIEGIASDKRKQGMLLVDKATAEVFILEGSPDVAGPPSSYTDGLFSIAPGQTGTPWKSVGSLELQTEDIDVNIDSDFNGEGKTFGKYHPSFTQTVGSQGSQVGIVPVAAWMTEKAANPGYAVIASSQGATALEIIRDALNEAFSLSPTVISSTTSVPFNEQDFTVSSITVNVPKANGVDIDSIVLKRREIGSSTFTDIPSGTFAQAQIDNSQATATVVLSNANFTPSDDFFDFDGFEIQAVCTDTSGATGTGSTNITRNNYVAPFATVTGVTRKYSNTTFAKNETDSLRVASNVDSRVTFNVTVSSANDSTVSGGTHKFEVYRREKVNGSFGVFASLGSPQVVAISNFSATGITFDDEGATAADIDSSEVQYKVIILDHYTETEGINMLTDNSFSWNNFTSGYDDFDSSAESAPYNSSFIHFRLPVFVGSYLFTDSANISNGSLSSINSNKLSELKVDAVAASSLTPSVFTDEDSLQFPRLFETFPFDSIANLIRPDNTVANGAVAGERFYFMYAENSGSSISFGSTSNSEAVGDLQIGSNTTPQLGAFVTSEYGASSGINVHGRLNGSAQYGSFTRRIENNKYRVYVQKTGNSTGGSVIKISD